MAQKLAALLKQASAAATMVDGREEAVMALASSVAGMALGAAMRIPWDKPLKAARLGLKTAADIQRFKENLARMLPQAADWIQAAPISTGNTLAAIADLVAAAKRSVAQPAQAPTYAIPAIVVKGNLSEARARVANILGKDFAEKVSDRFVYRAGLRMKVSPAADIATDSTALVLEFREGYEPLPAPPVFAGRESGGSEMITLLDAAIRGKEIEVLRSRFYTSITAMRADLERRVAPAVASRESGGATGQATVVCWLNGTMQVLGKPREVAYCAADPNVQRIGIPRLLEREMNVSIAAVGATAFRLTNAFDGAGIQIAVIDGECDPDHPALAGRIVHKNNFTKEPWGAPDPHGTVVAGILCSTHAAFGGICPGSTILNYKVFSTNPALQGTDVAATEALQSAIEDGARVANLSFGLGLGSNGDSREARSVNRAWRLGLTIVKSAGNRGPGKGTITSPGDAKDVIVVGATNRDGTALEPYSGRGPVGTRTGPDLLAPGASIGSQLQGLLLKGATGSAGWGTSLSAPHVTGLIALLLQQNPSLKPDDIRALLNAKCTPIGSSAVDSQGMGFLRF